MWNTYIAVDDVDAAADRAEKAGGQVVMPPFDVMDAGRMTFVIDPTGAAIAFWQAKGHIGATVVNEAGAVIWNELLTDDGEAATAFYKAVAGLEAEQMDMGQGPYTVAQGWETRWSVERWLPRWRASRTTGTSTSPSTTSTSPVAKAARARCQGAQWPDGDPDRPHGRR